MENGKYIVGSEPLTIERIGRILEKNEEIALGKEAVERIVKCREYLDKKMETCDTPIYGITTGFGSLCNVSIGILVSSVS